MIVNCTNCGSDVKVRPDRYDNLRMYYCKTCIPEKYHLKCIDCGNYFGSNSPSAKRCFKCRENMYAEIKCSNCDLILRRLKPTIKNINYCKRCTSIINGRKALTRYNKSEKGRRKSSEIGKRTIKHAIEAQQANNVEKYCSICEEITMHLSGPGCLKCHNNSEIMRKTTRARNLENWKDPEYARKIAKNLGENIEPNFETRDGLYFKGRPWINWCKEWDKDEDLALLHPGVEKRLGVWTYNRVDPLTDEKILLNSNFIRYKDKLFYKGIDWEEYKENFKRETAHKSVSDLAESLGGYIQKTYRIEEFSRSGQQAMEMELVEKEIGWFCYIKMYCDDKGIHKPLVVGKTGSLLVNISGTDVAFDYDIDYSGSIRPARMFLKDSDLYWVKDYIIAIPCEDEAEALDKESEISLMLNLFEM